MCFADFFPMFDVPFKYGSGWDQRADEGPEPVVVLDEETNDLLFGGQDSVGKTVRIEDREFQVVGVLDTWRPTVKFYDVTQNCHRSRPEGIFMPFNFLRPMQIRTAGNSDGWKSPPVPGLRGAAWSRRRAGSRCGSSCPTRPRWRPTRTSSTAYVQRAEEGRPLPAPAQQPRDAAAWPG